jgi:hypothetical protein
MPYSRDNTHNVYTQWLEAWEAVLFEAKPATTYVRDPSKQVFLQILAVLEELSA